MFQWCRFIGKMLVPLGGTLAVSAPQRSPLEGSIPNKYPLYKVYMGLIIKGTIPRVFSQSRPSQEWYGYTDDLSEVTSTVTMYLPDRDPEDLGRKKTESLQVLFVLSCLVLFCLFLCFVCVFVSLFVRLFLKCQPVNLVSDICLENIRPILRGVDCRFEASCISQSFRRKKHLV